MDRVIKFRGKNSKNGWITGYYFVNRGVHFIAQDGIANPLNTHEDYVVAPETIGQFTGYHDANGKEIYEGDILKNYSCEYDGDALYKIYWEENECGFAVEPINEIAEHEEVRKWHWLEDFEIIGNIHDNPELSEGGRQ